LSANIPCLTPCFQHQYPSILEDKQIALLLVITAHPLISYHRLWELFLYHWPTR